METKKSEILSQVQRKHIKDVFWDSNPISYQVLGICSALAVTVQVKTALVMVFALAFVLCLSNVIISLIRNLIPNSIRIIVFLVVIASLVVIIDELLKAYLFDISKQLSVFVGLIITNCIVMGRAEAFAIKNGPIDSFYDALGNAFGYGLFLVIIASIREVFGSGKFMGLPIIPDVFYSWGYKNAGIMLLAPAAFILLGLLVWLQKTLTKEQEEKR